MKNTEIIVIPKDTYHQRLESSGHTLDITFQKLINVKNCQKFFLSKWLIKELKKVGYKSYSGFRKAYNSKN